MIFVILYIVGMVVTASVTVVVTEPQDRDLFVMMVGAFYGIFWLFVVPFFGLAFVAGAIVKLVDKKLGRGRREKSNQEPPRVKQRR